MNAINSYIDHMFRSLPPTAEARRAKTELRQMSEDRYNELRAEGLSEHEAVGQVITQFGGLDEVADQLGIRSLVDNSEAHAVAFSDAEADRYVETRKRSSLMIAGGVALILLGLAAQFLINPNILSSAGDNLAGAQGALGLGVFLLAVAMAVGMFIVSGVSMSRFDIRDDQAIQLSAATTARYRQERADYTQRYGIGLAVGVVIIVLSLAALLVSSALAGSLTADSTEVSAPGLAAMFAGVAIGVAVLIITGMRRGTLDRLTSSGEYAPDLSGTRSMIERISGPYWMLALAVYLIWSFGWDAWEQSWLVWPIAGVLFGFLAATIGAIKTGEEKRQYDDF